MAGRPTKLTLEVQEKICDAIKGGNHQVVAAAYAGIGESTYYAWLERGVKNKSGEYVEFVEAVKKAQADAETRNVLLIQTAAKETWTAAAWWLERKYPDRWGRVVQDVRLSGNVSVATITADELAEVEKGLDDFERTTKRLPPPGDETQ